MKIEEAKNIIDCQFRQAIYSDVILDNFHPLRVVQALKSLIGIDIKNPSSILIEWGDRYLKAVNQLPKDYFSYSIKPTKETVVLSNLGRFILSKKYEEGIDELQDLCSVSDGNQIFEYLLEFACKWNKSAIPFIWSAFRTSIFLKNKCSYSLLSLSIKILIDDKLDNNGFMTKFEESCVLESVRYSSLTRQDNINKYLIDSQIQFDLDFKDIVTPVDVIGKGRVAILDYLNNLDVKNITKEMILFLDGCRMALKDTPKKSHITIGHILNQTIERKLHVEKNW